VRHARLAQFRKEVDAVLKLDGPARFAHFIKRAADEETVWGLWNDGWALMAHAGEGSAFPVWPAQEYAMECAIGEWSAYTPESIPLNSLLDELLPKLTQKNVAPAVFPTPTGRGVVVTPQELEKSLRAELMNYE
jgi:hypothetical protein